MTRVKILLAVPSVWLGGKKYGPFEVGQIVDDLPDELVQRLLKQKIATKVIEGFEDKIDLQTESRLRRIAAKQDIDGDAFMREFVRLISEGLSDMDALSQTMKVFEKPKKKPTLANFLPDRLEEPTPPPPKPEAKPKPKEKKGVEINPELSSWLAEHGFVREPEGVAYVKQEKVGGDSVKLQVDFSDTPKGTRYGYRLNSQFDPPKWKSDPALHDHPLLLQFKRFRDDLLAQRDARVQIPPAVSKPTEIPTAEGQVLMQKEAEAMDAKDDTQILAEMKGEFKAEVLKQLFYSFESGGRRVVGLSYKGVKQMAMRQGHIKVKELELKETEKAWIATCKAKDKAKDLEVYGAAIQPKEITFRNGGKMPDPFAMSKAVSKAQRNALRGLISEVVITEAYKRWIEGRR